MFELILNAVRVMTSKDFREGAGDLLALVRKTPEWKEGASTIEAKVSHDLCEHASLLLELACARLTEMSFPIDAVSAFRTCFVEFTRNALEHGGGSEIGIRIELWSTFASIRVRNGGKGFNLADAIARSSAILDTSPSHPRRRGLLLASDRADSISQAGGGEDIKAVIYKDRVRYKVFDFDGFAVIEIIDGLFNPSFVRRIMTIASAKRGGHIVFDFTLCLMYESTLLSFVTLTTSELLASGGKIVRCLLPSDELIGAREYCPMLLPEEVLAKTWSDALEAIQKGSFVDNVRSAMTESRRRRYAEEDSRHMKMLLGRALELEQDRSR